MEINGNHSVVHKEISFLICHQWFATSKLKKTFRFPKILPFTEAFFHDY